MRDQLTGRVKVTSLLIILFAIAAIGILVINRQKSDIALLEASAKETRARQVEVESERSDLQYELSISDSDDYIAEKARTLYGYLLPGEIRFKVTNLEALYGDEEPTAQIVEEGR